MTSTFAMMLIGFALGASAGCAAAAIVLAGWEHKPRHLPPKDELTTYR